MTSELEIGLYIFILAGFLGYHVISRVPPLLHTPLMSATNAISGISLIGSLVVAGSDYTDSTKYPHSPHFEVFGTVVHLSTLLGFLAVACSSTNVVGGFLITDRMLKMFKKREDIRAERGGLRFSWSLLMAGLLAISGAVAIALWPEQLRSIHPNEILRYLYILSAVLFILGMKGLSSPKYARRGMFLAEFGMLVAIVGTLFDENIKTYWWITVGLILGSIVGATMGLRIPMTAVPHRTALSHSLGALAAALVGISEYWRHQETLGRLKMSPLGFEVV